MGISTIILIAAVLGLAIAVLAHPERTLKEAMRVSGRQALFLIPVIIPAIISAGFVAQLLPSEEISRWVGPDAGFTGAMIAAACLLQLLTGVAIDSRYEGAILREYPFAILYPLAYWMIMSASSAIYSTKGFVQRLDLTKPVRWRIVREAQE